MSDSVVLPSLAASVFLLKGSSLKDDESDGNASLFVSSRMGDNCTIISFDAGNIAEGEFDIDVEFAKSCSKFVCSLGFSLCDYSSYDNGSITDVSFSGGNKSFVGEIIGDDW